MLSTLIKDSLKPILRKEGFKSKGLQWNRARSEFVDVVTVQEAKHSSADERVFTVNIGLFSPEIHEIIWGQVPSGLVTEADCVVRLRLGDLIQGKLNGDAKDQWWTIIDTSTSESVSNELISNFNELVLPFFSSLDSYESIRIFTDSMGGWLAKNPLFLIQRALVQWKCGSPERGLEILEQVTPKAWEPRVQTARNAMERKVNSC